MSTLSALDDLPRQIAGAALNESVFAEGVFEADDKPYILNGTAFGFVTDDEGSKLRITVEWVPEDHEHAWSGAVHPSIDVCTVCGAVGDDEFPETGDSPREAS